MGYDHIAWAGSGGGVKAAAHVGARRHLIVNKGLKINMEAGNSGDMLNCCFMVQYGVDDLYSGIAKLQEVWHGIRKPSDVAKDQWVWNIPRRLAVESNEPLWQLFKRSVDPARVAASGRFLRIPITDLVEGRVKVLNERGGEGAESAPTARAALTRWFSSSVIPWIFPPREDGAEGTDEEMFLVDGGLGMHTPAAPALEWLLLQPGPAEKKLLLISETYTRRLPRISRAKLRGNPKRFTERVIDIMVRDNSLGDVDRTEDIARAAGITVVRVMLDLDREDTTDFTPGTISRIMDHGYQAWKDAMP